jgi:F0F1-type ATP synthase assembly protein I
MDDPDRRDESRKILESGRHKVDLGGASLAGIGLQFAALILIFVFAGQWLDRRLDTQWFTIVGVFLGAGLGITSMYRRLMAEQRKADEASRRKDPPA